VSLEHLERLERLVFQVNLEQMVSAASMAIQGRKAPRVILGPLVSLVNLEQIVSRQRMSRS
jgi:hypothetical protein